MKFFGSRNLYKIKFLNLKFLLVLKQQVVKKKLPEIFKIYFIVIFIIARLLNLFATKRLKI